MSELPKIHPEELYKTLYEKVLEESKEFKVQLTSVEILATKLRNERDTAQEKVASLEAKVAELNQSLKTLREPDEDEEILEPDEIIS